MAKGQSAVADYEMEERKAPVFIQWDKEGNDVSGILVAMQLTEMDGKKVPKFMVFNQEEDQMYSFLGTYDLCQKIRLSDCGRFVSIRYEGEDPNIGRNGKNMKIFKVQISSVKAKDADKLIITDADIPF